MTKRNLVIATRKSPLALSQADIISRALTQVHPHLTIDILGLTTEGDTRLDINLMEIGGKGLFVKELEAALYDGRADIAVHSMKDVPMTLPEGLSIPVMLKREEVRDVFIANRYRSLAELPAHAIVGTSSLRRRNQLNLLRQDLTYLNLRGNVHTRLKKLDEGEYTAIVLAAAGLKRLQITERIQAYFSIDEMLPAAGQGALGIECREDDDHVKALIAPLHDGVTFQCVTAERALCRRLGGGCKLPIGAYATIHQGLLTIRGLVAGGAHQQTPKSQRTGEMQQAESLGLRVAEELISLGALKILT